MSAHLDAERLGDLDEGLLAEPEARAARAHLAACTECTALHDDLHAVSALLRGLPDPGPMPPALAARLDHALLAGGRAAGDVTPLRPRGERPSRRWSTALLQVAAALVVLGALGGLVVGALRSTGTDSATSSASASGGAGAALSEDSAAVRISATGHAYTTATLAADVRLLLAGRLGVLPATGDAAGESASKSPQQAPPLSRTSVDSCAGALSAGAVRRPLAVDSGTFGGSPAQVYVFPGEEDPRRVEIFVVSPGCRPAAEQLRYFATATLP